MKKYGSEIILINKSNNPTTKQIEITDSIQTIQDKYEDFKLVSMFSLGPTSYGIELALIFEYWDSPEENEV